MNNNESSPFNLDRDPFRSKNSNQNINHPSQKNVNKLKPLLTSLIILLVVILAIVFVKDLFLSEEVAADSDLYQAVFLTNGEVYFGKVTSNDDQYLVLEDIYYLRVTPALQQSPDGSPVANQQQQINLIKLGEELHGPQDKMFIPLKSVVYWENIEADSQVATTIEQAANQIGDDGPISTTPATPTTPAQPVQNPPANEIPDQPAIGSQDNSLTTTPGQ